MPQPLHPALADDRGLTPRIRRDPTAEARLRSVAETGRAVQLADPGVPTGPPRTRHRSRAVAAAAGITAAGLAGAAGMGGNGAAQVSASSTADSQLFSLTNQDRTSNGVASLQWNSTLSTIGEGGNYGGCGFNVQGRALDQIQRNYFAHPILNCGQYVFSMMTAYGLNFQSAGENIGWNNNGSESSSVVAIEQSFMNSTEHRSNILNPNYTHVGIGSANSGAGSWSGGGSNSFQNVSMYAVEFAQLPGVGADALPPPPPNTTPLVNAAAAVQGTDSAVYEMSSGTYQPLGGATLGAPAVVAVPTNAPNNQMLYIVTGTDHHLWIRSDSIGWSGLASGPAYCLNGPAASAANGVLTVACRGGDNALWTASGPLPKTGLPVVGSFSSAGGVIIDGPGLATVGGQTAALVLGQTSRVYSWTAAAGFRATPWVCTGHPAFKSTGTTAYFGCHGADGALWWSRNTGNGWSAPQSAGGRIVDGAGVAVQNGGASFFVEGVDGEMWQVNVVANGGATGYSPRGGGIVHGAGADGF